MRIIPRNTKVKLEFFKGIDVLDVLLGLLGFGLALALFLSNLTFHIGIAIGVLFVTGVLLVPLDEDKIYITVWNMMKYTAYRKHFAKRETENVHTLQEVPDSQEEVSLNMQADVTASEEAEGPETQEEPAVDKKKEKKEKKKTSKKSKTSKGSARKVKKGKAVQGVKASGGRKKKVSKQFDVKSMVPFTGIEDGLIDYNREYYGAVLEIPHVEFRFMNEYQQENLISRALGRILRGIGENQSINLVKLDRPIMYDAYQEVEQEKTNRMLDAEYNGVLSSEELKPRVDIVEGRKDKIQRLNHIRVLKAFHYLVIYGKDKDLLRRQIQEARNSLNTQGMNTRTLNDKEIAVFLRYSNGYDFDEREIENIPKEQYVEWASPGEINLSVKYVAVDGLTGYCMKVSEYPMTVENAWGATIMNELGSKVVIKVKPLDRFKAVQRIDRSMEELRSQGENTGKASRIIEINQHLQNLSELLRLLQSDNETLFEVGMYVTAYDHDHYGQGVTKDSYLVKRNIKRMFREEGFRIDDLWMQQFEGYVGSQVSAYDPMLKKARGIHSTSIAAVFPYVFAVMQDEEGVNIGSSMGYPVFIDFFKRDHERVNSNAVIIGKSGSGKSFATKTILSHLTADDSKIFILDPENEYGGLAENFHGKVIDAGTAKQGRLNPFQVIASADDIDEEMGGGGTSFSAHLQFLEEFFQQILPGLSKDALEFLNNIISNMYLKKGIDQYTDLAGLTPADYPIFDDLYDCILEDYQNTDGEYAKDNLRTLMNYISKFSTGGRNSGLWNGEATITTAENLVVFNFQSLLANKNNTIANAQMLLVLKYLDNEIIKNRDYNLAHGQNRKIIIVIDEAHVFIDEKYPIALDFMFQMAKRIRKYNGMQIIITQNIKDFVGSEELSRKSTAIINACQYSFIFALAPNDMNDLCTLYEKAGGINEMEQNQIINNERGQAFVITSPTSRFMLSIEAEEWMTKYFR